MVLPAILAGLLGLGATGLGVKNLADAIRPDEQPQQPELSDRDKLMQQLNIPQQEPLIGPFSGAIRAASNAGSDLMDYIKGIPGSIQAAASEKLDSVIPSVKELGMGLSDTIIEGAEGALDAAAVKQKEIKSKLIDKGVLSPTEKSVAEAKARQEAASVDNNVVQQFANILQANPNAITQKPGILQGDQFIQSDVLPIRTNMNIAEEIIKGQLAADNINLQRQDQLNQINGLQGALFDVLPKLNQQVQAAQAADKQSMQDQFGFALGAAIPALLSGNPAGLSQAASALSGGGGTAGAASQAAFNNSLKVVTALNSLMEKKGSFLTAMQKDLRDRGQSFMKDEQDFISLQEKRINLERQGLAPSQDRVIVGGKPYKSIPGLKSISSSGDAEELFIDVAALDAKGQLSDTVKKEVSDKMGLYTRVDYSMNVMQQIIEQVGPTFDPSLAGNVTIIDPRTGEKRTVNAAAELGVLRGQLVGEFRNLFKGPLDEQMERVIAMIVADPLNPTSALKALGTEEVQRLIDQTKVFRDDMARDKTDFLNIRGIKQEMDVYKDAVNQTPGFQTLQAPTASGKKYAFQPEGSDEVILMNDEELKHIMRLLFRSE